MKIFENSLYMEDVRKVVASNITWEKLQNNSIVITGATGLIGSFLCDVIMHKNEEGLNCSFYALGRSEEKTHNRFEYCWDNPLFHYVKYDVNEPINIQIAKVGYVLHLASNTHPVAYASDPIGTIAANIIGLKNMLDFCVEHSATRFAFTSSNEVYGENRGDTEKFDEKYCGYIDANTLRAGYPESKRCAEALCQAYIAQKGLDVVIPRITRSYGPTVLKNDTKAMSQFINKAINGENIVLKSEGNQYYSYTYVVDAVSGLLMVLLNGKTGEAYNISDEKSDIRLKDLAQLIADSVGRKVVFEIPDSVESTGYSKATKARLDSAKINTELGWRAQYSIEDGIYRTISILKEINS